MWTMCEMRSRPLPRPEFLPPSVVEDIALQDSARAMAWCLIFRGYAMSRWMRRNAGRGLRAAACWDRWIRKHKKQGWSFHRAWYRIRELPGWSWAEGPDGLPGDLDCHAI